MGSSLSFTSNSFLPRMGGVVLRMKNSPFWLPALKNCTEDIEKKFANSCIRPTEVMNLVLDPFVLEHVPNFVDVAFAEDVVHRLKERSTDKIDSEQWQDWNWPRKILFRFCTAYKMRIYSCDIFLLVLRSFKQFQFIQKNISFSISTIPFVCWHILGEHVFLAY